MENPASWNETQKTIGRVLLTKNEESTEDEYHDRIIAGVIVSLRENKLLKDTDHNLEEVLLEEIDLYHRLLARGNCGRSLTSRMYYKLLSLGAL
jgi:hypothetical protein